MSCRNKSGLKSRNADGAAGGETTGGAGVDNPSLQDRPAAGPGQNEHCPRILVVDDDAELRSRYSTVLIQSGYRVDAVADDTSGWELFSGAGDGPDNYQLLITNSEKPRLPYTGTLNRQSVTKKTLLIIPASGMVSEDTERLRLVAILPKPVASHDLMQRVKTVLRDAIGRHHDAA